MYTKITYISKKSDILEQGWPHRLFFSRQYPFINIHTLLLPTLTTGLFRLEFCLMCSIFNSYNFFEKLNLFEL